ncbi:MAG: ATP-binding cassette domain-containing protein, partial [Bifidobacteriaceae bacterium]|nr:ATP-binding cassette domain-containing protein [Bifidobacteriaceae bacterium]
VLLGLLAPDGGKVSVRTEAGHVIGLDQIDPESWWRQIAWVPQRPVLLPGTVWENLTGRFGEDRPADADGGMEGAALAARRAGFAPVVEALPEGWDTRVGHGGVGLSVGQRQRLALGRALIEDRALVILDEPTAHLDPETERTVLDAIAHLAAGGRTVLVVAHREALLAEAGQTCQVESRTAQEAAL